MDPRIREDDERTGVLPNLKVKDQEGAVPDPVLLDTSALELRQVPQEKIEAYRRNPDYRYSLPSEATDWRARVNRWLTENIFGPLVEGASSKAFAWFIRIAAALFLIWAVYRALKIKTRSTPLAASEPENVHFEEVTDVQAIDFDALIESAAGRGDYRQAIRYCYLKTLQVLQARGFLTWKPGKTNAEYVAEVRRQAPNSLAVEFADITSTYEYVWYGAFSVGAPAFETARRHLNAFAGSAGREPS